MCKISQLAEKNTGQLAIRRAYRTGALFFIIRAYFLFKNRRENSILNQIIRSISGDRVQLLLLNVVSLLALVTYFFT